ncbi:hypothetical protein DENSPDRAFT_581245 [Dentipellis sp. KUC8613]|nr:hypothetical protein DENSPDRAFT_581245 [Dentipellis sp. KUC8613]
MVQLEELTDKTCTIDTDAFLSRILPITANDIDRVFCRLASGAVYSGTRWRSFPVDGCNKKKAHLYAPFVRVANEILDACRAEPGIAVGIQDLCWRVQNEPGRDEAPGTALDEDNEDGDKDKDTSLIRLRPSIVASLSDDAEADAIAANEAELLKHVRDLGENAKIPRTQHEELSKKLSRWWLRVHVPVEVQYEDSEEEMWAGVDRLCGYMKSVLAEQLDRRFAVGLLVCKDKLTVWLCDRSGLIGTRVPIDIQKEPKKFIHVMMGLSCLEPARLGWDPTMKIVCQGMDGTEHRLSTSAQVTINDFGRTAYETKWAIFVPKEDGSAAGEWYTTSRILSVERVAMMTGRATLIWVVTKAGDSTRKRFVLKQTWRPDYAYTEAEFRALAPPDSNLYQIVRSVDVGAGDIDDQASAAAVVDTEYYVRRGLPGASDSNSAPPAKKLRPGEEPGSPAVVLFIVDPATEDTTGEKGSESVRRGRFRFTNRVLTRTLMSTYGWPVEFFRDHRELVETIRDAVKGHQDLWFGGVLHRDVSVGNILICPEENGDRKTRGRLIDLDFSKMTTDDDAPVSTHSSEMTDDISIAEKVTKIIGDARFYEKVTIDESTALALLLRYSGAAKIALKYIDVVLEIYPHLRGVSRPLSKEDLRVYDVARAPPREIHHSQTPEKTGTKAFMSAEVLTNQPNWPDAAEGPEKYINNHIFHSAIHDLESFFWVLVYLCLTRAGPGGEHRDPPEDSKTCAQLDNIVACLFTSEDDSVLARNKHDLFQCSKDLHRYIIPHFHPYFQCLSGLVLDWWNALQLAYRTYDALTPGFIHQQVLDVLDNAMKNLPDPVPSKEMEREDNRRTTDLESTATKPPSWGSSPSRKSELKSGSYRESTTITSPTPGPQKKKARVHTSDSSVGSSR